MTEQKNSPVVPVATEKRPNRQVSVTVPAEFYDGFYDHRWTAKKEIGKMFKEALDTYAGVNNIAVDGSAPHAPKKTRDSK